MANLRIIIAGGSGFIGQSLVAPLLERGYDLVILTRSPQKSSSTVRQVGWNGRSLDDWAVEMDGAHAVINLTGKSVNCRPTAENHRVIIESRIHSVRAIGQAVRQAAHPPKVWIQASSLAYYGDAGEKICDEQTPPWDDVTAGICVEWEKALAEAYTPATRKVALRIGFALGRGGGALGTLERIARWFLGGRVGTGRQYISWLHMDDLCGVVMQAMERDDFVGAYNLCAPNPVTNAQFMRQLRRALGRPWSPPAPAWAVRLAAVALRTDPALALTGRRCIPKRLLEQNHPFHFTDLAAAMENLYP